MSEEKKYENIFADGMIFKKPHEKAPDFVKGNISIKVEAFIAFLNKYKKEDGWVNIDLKKAKSGKLYLALNTYEKKQSAQSAQTEQPKKELPTVSVDEPPEHIEPGEGDINIKDIPL